MILPWNLRPDWPELSDLIHDVDPATLARRPVDRDQVVARVEAMGNAAGARILRDLPDWSDDGIDRLLVAAHFEIQRLALEVQAGPRMARLVRAAVGAVRAGDPRRPVTVVDVGCGTGYVVRWLAAHTDLDVRWVGADFNRALIEAGRALAIAEGLRVELVHADAFAVPDATVYLSSGVLHHVPRASLPAFFGAQRAAEVAIHLDFQPSWLAPLGSWMFHVARMRLPLSVHDGILSAVRAWPADVLMEAARAGLPWDAEVRDRWLGAVPRAMQALVLTRPERTAALRSAL